MKNKLVLCVMVGLLITLSGSATQDYSTMGISDGEVYKFSLLEYKEENFVNETLVSTSTNSSVGDLEIFPGDDFSMEILNATLNTTDDTIDVEYQVGETTSATDLPVGFYSIVSPIEWEDYLEFRRNEKQQLENESTTEEGESINYNIIDTKEEVGYKVEIITEEETTYPSIFQHFIYERSTGVLLYVNLIDGYGFIDSDGYSEYTFTTQEIVRQGYNLESSDTGNASSNLLPLIFASTTVILLVRRSQSNSILNS